MTSGINESKAIAKVECRCKLNDMKCKLRQKKHDDKY